MPPHGSDTFKPSVAVWQIHVPDGCSAAARPNRVRTAAALLYRNAPLVIFGIWLVSWVYSPLLLLGLVSIPILFGARWLVYASPLRATRVNVAILVLLLAFLFGMLRASNLTQTVMPVMHLLTGITVFFVLLDYADHTNRLWNVAAVLLILGVIIAFASPFLAQPPGDKFFDVVFLFHPDRVPLLHQTNPNILAGLFAMLIPLALSLLFSADALYRRIGSLTIGPIVVMLLLLQARGAWIAALVGLTVWGSLYKRRRLALVPVLLLAFAFFSILADQIPAYRFRAFGKNAAISMEGREAVWLFAIQQLRQEPLGIGIGEYPRYARTLGRDYLEAPQRQNAHNTFLQAGLDTGIVGVASYIVIWEYALYASWHAIKRHVKQTLAIGLLAALCTALASGMLEANWWSNGTAIFSWALFGMAAVLGRVGTRKHRETDTPQDLVENQENLSNLTTFANKIRNSAS